MSTPTPAGKISVASVSDRGLNPKRPLNEDSFLADSARGIFVVADGVGGAEAGEVASATAVDVLNRAFHEKLAAGEDAEDLMELAIQRANSSIHHMAAEHPRLSSMATTVVALHLDGRAATFGHVGDSRLYRLTPDGKLVRETADHSVVEEEVRAGRMTAEQAANHPSKNVISRALGAEALVEVDMKTTEVDDGSTFLLCTDGITRHIPDNELRELLMSGRSAEAICAEMKQRCFQRGAEDNLTAVIVQVGTPKFDAPAIDDERTVDARLESATVAPAKSETRLVPPSRIAVPGPATQPAPADVSTSGAKSSPRRGRPVLRFFVFLLFLGAAGGGFYGGMRYQKSLPVENTATAQPSPDDRAAAFERKRAAVDADSQKWLAENLPIQLSKEGISKATESKDPEFLYLYGRALMLAGNHRDAVRAFELALTNLRTEAKTKLPLNAELKLAAAAAALKSKPKAPSQEAAMAEQKAMRTLDDLLGLKGEVAPK
jgi:serine/threonine protein phosphatase PrpC